MNLNVLYFQLIIHKFFIFTFIIKTFEFFSLLFTSAKQKAIDWATVDNIGNMLIMKNTYLVHAKCLRSAFCAKRKPLTFHCRDSLTWEETWFKTSVRLSILSHVVQYNILFFVLRSESANFLAAARRVGSFRLRRTKKWYTGHGHEKRIPQTSPRTTITCSLRHSLFSWPRTVIYYSIRRSRKVRVNFVSRSGQKVEAFRSEDRKEIYRIFTLTPRIYVQKTSYGTSA